MLALRTVVACKTKVAANASYIRSRSKQRRSHFLGASK